MVNRCWHVRVSRSAPPAAQWVGYIKDYDGGTLMECAIYAALPYLGLPAMVAAQRAALDRRIRALSNAHVVHPGLPPGARPVPIGDIPGGSLVPKTALQAAATCCE